MQINVRKQSEWRRDLNLSSCVIVLCMLHLYWIHTSSFMFIATDTLCRDYLENNSYNNWLHKTDIFTYFAILEKQRQAMNSESVKEVSRYRLCLCTKYVSASCHCMIFNKAAITTLKIRRMTCTNSKRKVRYYELIFIFFHLFALPSTSTHDSEFRNVFLSYHRKQCDSLLILMNLVGFLIFRASALDNKLMAVYSRKYHLSKSCFPCQISHTSSRVSAFPFTLCTQERKSN